MRTPAVIALVVSLAGAAAAPSQEVRSPTARWEDDVQAFFRTSDAVSRFTAEEKEAFFAREELDATAWARIVRHMADWIRTPEGFAAAREQLGEALSPVEGVSLERYGRLNARVTNGEAQAAVLADAGLDAGAWNEVQATWTKRMREDRAFVLTTLYSHHYLAAIEGRYAAAARDASQGMLPGNTLEGPEPVPFERFLEIQTAVSVGARHSRDPAAIPKEDFELSFADWVAIMNWWGTRETQAVAAEDYSYYHQRISLQPTLRDSLEAKYSGLEAGP